VTRLVIWSTPARRDFAQILDHIAQDNPDAAERVRSAIDLSATKLGQHSTGRPGRGGGKYYEKTISNLPYIIAYSIRGGDGGEEIYILRVIHSARDWPVGGRPKD